MTLQTSRFKQVIDATLADIATYQGKIGQDADLGMLNGLSTALKTLGDAFRERMQEETGLAVRAIINKLEDGHDPDAQDVSLIRAWIVGDAASYTKMEQDRGKWLEELNRLLGEIAQTQGRDLTPDEILDTQAQVQDALRTAADIHYFDEQWERVRHFEEATARWSPEDKTFIARMLRSKLASVEV